jgi:hypothetical protein
MEKNYKWERHLDYLMCQAIGHKWVIYHDGSGYLCMRCGKELYISRYYNTTQKPLKVYY